MVTKPNQQNAKLQEPDAGMIKLDRPVGAAQTFTTVSVEFFFFELLAGVNYTSWIQFDHQATVHLIVQKFRWTSKKGVHTVDVRNSPKGVHSLDILGG